MRPDNLKLTKRRKIVTSSVQANEHSTGLNISFVCPYNFLAESNVNNKHRFAAFYSSWKQRVTNLTPRANMTDTSCCCCWYCNAIPKKHSTSDTGSLCICTFWRWTQMERSFVPQILQKSKHTALLSYIKLKKQPRNQLWSPLVLWWMQGNPSAV